MSIGNRIKEARLRAGISQEALAKSVGVTKGAIGNYETDISSPKEPILIKLMDILNVDANYIYQDYIKNPISNFKFDVDGITDKEKAILVAYRSHPEMQNAVDTLLGVQQDAAKPTLQEEAM